jgi:hypothetical protein
MSWLQPISGTTEPHRADRVLIALDPIALLAGRIALHSADISGVGLQRSQGAGFDLSDLAGLRVDATGELDRDPLCRPSTA